MNDPVNDAIRRGPGGSAPDDVDLSRVWLNVATEVWRRQPSWPERMAAKLLRSPGLSRALLTTPSLLLPWLVSSVVILGTGAIVHVRPGESLVWVLAPVMAAIGIAYAYGPGLDPAWELGASCAVSDRMVLLVRAVAVFGVNAAFGLAASVVSPSVAALTFAWLIPMAAVCALTLAVAVTVRNAAVGATVGAGVWLATVFGGAAAGDLDTAVSNTTLYAPYLVIAACCAAITVYATRLQRGTQ
jgi:hypothetical protein